MREFHITRRARDRYQFDESLFTIDGNIIFANFHSARVFTQKINQKLDLVNYPERAVKAGQISAIGLIDEIFHYIIDLYQRQKQPKTMENALKWVSERIGEEKLETVLLEFVDDFPTLDIYNDNSTISDYLESETKGVSNKAITLEELLLLWLTNTN
ncbi:MAG: alpha-amylase, partial [Anaerolineaceae bacterium]|nr:alpha-amylase [Anaerolineaceae bacterium]